MNIQETLKKQFREEKLSEIEAFALNSRDKSLSHRKDFIMALYYLQFTKRFRENPAYKKESFEIYINDMFVLRLTTFNQERWAFIKHGKAATKHGPGIIASIKRRCGHANVEKVIGKINSAESKRKTPLPRNKKEAIILTYALPVKEKPYQEPRTAIETKLLKAEKIIQSDRKEKVEQDDQIGRLKITIETLKAENARLKAIIAEYEAKEQRFISILDFKKPMEGAPAVI